MNNPFEPFYDTEVQIIQITEKGVYEKLRTEKVLGTIYADIQPYGGGLAEEKYGYKSECQFRMFCDNTEGIAMGNYIRYKDKTYKIAYVAEGEMGPEVLLNEYIV